MAFLKYAYSTLVKPAISMPAWDEVRAKAVTLGSAFDQRTAMSKVVLQKYDPKQVMISHCTIIASVDTEETGLPLGKQMVDGTQIDRRWGDFYITPKTSKFINNNHDSFERRLLLASYRTFVGGENYVEHLQIPELSKGKIIDAVARDIGDSVYVDILVATDLKHQPLVRAIKAGQLSTLSMGAQVSHTTCTKCGNVAEDETQLCTHIRFQKGNHFIDSLGQSRKIAELCGFRDEPTSVKFIEASWVANPAFTGAVLRDVLSPAENAAYQHRIQVAFSMPTRVVGAGAYAKAARTNYDSNGRVAINNDRLLRTPANNPRSDVSKFAFETEEEFPGADSGEAPEEPKEKSPFDKAVDSLADSIREKAIQKVRDELSGPEIPRADLSENRNDTLVKQAVSKDPAWQKIARYVLAQTNNPELARKLLHGLMLHKGGGWQAVRTARQFSGVDCLAMSRMLDLFHKTPKTAGEARIYRTVCAVGGVAAYGDENGFLAACRRTLGRQLTGTEIDALLTKGRIYDLGS